MNRVVRMVRTAAALLAAALLASAMAAVGPANATTACATQDVPASITKRPVVLVHGWNGGPGSWDKTVAAMTAAPYRSNKTFRLLRFDYAKFSADWPNEREVSGCLAEFLVKVSRRWKADGGDGQVLAVGHSMGGIALRFAAQLTYDGTKAGDVLGGVVTLGTPHTGSPWGGTLPAAFLQYLQTRDNKHEMTPPAGSNAEICLLTQESREPACAEPPLFPARIPLTSIGTQISIDRDIFGFTLAKFQLFGDGIVPADSSTGYPRSGPSKTGGGRETMPSGTDLRAVTEPCEYASSGLYGFGVKASLLQLQADNAATEAILRGDAGLAVLEVTFAALGKPCFHSGLTSEPRVVADTWLALNRYAKALNSAATADDFATNIVGEWERHGSFLTISSLTSGRLEQTIGYGGCDLPDDNRCRFTLELSLKVRGESLQATVTHVRVTEDNDFPLDASFALPYKVGYQFTLRFAHPNLLADITDTYGSGTTYYCNGKTAALYWETQNLCGA